MYRQLSMYPSVALHDRERVRTRLVTRASSLIIDGVGSNPVWNSGFFLELMLLLNFKKILMILTLENNNTYYCMSPVKAHTQNKWPHTSFRCQTLRKIPSLMSETQKFDITWKHVLCVCDSDNIIQGNLTWKFEQLHISPCHPLTWDAARIYTWQISRLILKQSNNTGNRCNMHLCKPKKNNKVL